MMEVLIEDDAAVLRLSTWTENLGWNCQKTMRVDAAMLDDLHRAISAARYKLNRQKTENGESVSKNVIEFPAFA